MLNFKLPPLHEIIFSTALEIRISDINYGNHLGHDSLISLLHETRVRFLREKGFTESNIDGLGILVTDLVVNYLNEAFYSDKILINLSLGEQRRTGLQLLYQVLTQESQQEIARALTTLTFYDYQSKKVKKIPSAFLDALKISP